MPHVVGKRLLVIAACPRRQSKSHSLYPRMSKPACRMYITLTLTHVKQCMIYY